MASATATVSLAALSVGVGAGDTVDFTTAKRVVTMVLVPTGTVTGGQVAMEASHDGTNWVTHQVMTPLDGSNSACNSTNGAYRYWRSSITSAITGGGSVTTTFMEAG